MKHAVLVPYFGNEDPDHKACVREAVGNTIPFVNISNCPYIDIARGSLVQTALDATDADVLVWIDHDIIFQPKDVELLARHCWESDYGVLGAAYSHRRPSQGLIGKPVKSVSQIVFYTPGLFDAEFVGMGFTAIKRSTFEALNDVCPLVYCPITQSKIRPYFLNRIDYSMTFDCNHTALYLGEDVSFCSRVQDAGIKIGIDAEPRVLHRGRKDYAIEDAAFDSGAWAETVRVQFQAP